MTPQPEPVSDSLLALLVGVLAGAFGALCWVAILLKVFGK
jgi:hypothetical protein